ncbi:MAG: hypothetical protein ACOC5I_02925, partial [Gemmatimonadota bacterium]
MMAWRDLVRTLTRSPRQPWPDGALHHGARVILLLVVAITTTVLFPVSPLPDAPPVELGAILEEDVIAEVPFPVYKSEEELERERREAAARINPIFVYDSTAVDSMLTAVNAFFRQADSITTGSRSGDRQELRDLLAAYSVPPSASDVNLLMNPETRTRLEESVIRAIRTDLSRGVAMGGELERAGGQRLAILGLDVDEAVPADSTLDNTAFYDRARRYVPDGAPEGFGALQRVLLVRFMVPSLRPDWEATELYRERARGAVSPIKTRIQEQQRVVPAREPVTEADVERFRSYRQELERLGRSGSGRGLRALGGFLFNLVTLTLFGVLLLLYRPEIYRNLRHLTVITVLVLTLIAVASIVAASQDRMVSLVPIAFPALVVATLWDGRLALNMSLILAVLLTGQAPFLGITSLLTLVAAGAVASLSVRVVRRRAQTWVFIALIAGAYVLVDLVLLLRQGWGFSELVRFGGLGRGLRRRSSRSRSSGGSRRLLGRLLDGRLTGAALDRDVEVLQLLAAGALLDLGQLDRDPVAGLGTLVGERRLEADRSCG